MFEKARLRLTAWYLAIIMAISLLFSFFIYSGVDAEFRRIEYVEARQREHIESGLGGRRHAMPSVDPALIQEARFRVIATLGFINLGILMVAGGAGYFLAGRTLRPIKDMVDDQRRFVADASHELRTPLTSLRSEIEVGLRDKHMSMKEARELLASNLEEVISLQGLSDNLLTLAAHETVIPKKAMKDVLLRYCVESAVKKLTGAIKRKQIRVRTQVDDVRVRGVQDRICELIVILLDNAVKYSPSRSTVTVSIQKKGINAVISVADQGRGIAKKEIPHIFDRFYRTSMSRSKDAVLGHGLGLSIAKKIVDTHQGSIGVKSTEGKGATFIVTLPAV